MPSEYDQEQSVRGVEVADQEILGSHSGASFEIIGDVLIKRAKGIGKSAEMQLLMNSPNYPTPTVYGYSADAMCMQYIKRHRTGAVHISEATTKARELYNQVLVGYVLHHVSTPSVFNGRVLIIKLEEIFNRCEFQTDRNIILKIMTHIDHSYVLPTGQYHGDLTYSNLIFTDADPMIYKPFYFIDFLPGYINSPVLDIVKLKQEYKLEWSRRVLPPGRLDKIRYQLALADLRCRIESVSVFKFDTTIFEAINLARILPYCKREEIRKLLHTEINKLL